MTETTLKASSIFGLMWKEEAFTMNTTLLSEYKRLNRSSPVSHSILVGIDRGDSLFSTIHSKI